MAGISSRGRLRQIEADHLTLFDDIPILVIIILVKVNSR
jgi:hypothetical protein